MCGLLKGHVCVYIIIINSVFDLFIIIYLVNRLNITLSDTLLYSLDYQLIK